MTSKTRADFERWISSPPYEREVERFGEGSAWPGNYRELDVDLAWQAWLAATSQPDETALLRQALDRLETLAEHCEYMVGDNECRPLENANATIAALRERLEGKT